MSVASTSIRRAAREEDWWDVGLADPVDALILDLLEWIGSRPREYSEVIEAWHTSCPRLPVWEEANARGLLTRINQGGAGTLVALSDAGTELLEKHWRGARGTSRR